MSLKKHFKGLLSMSEATVRPGEQKKETEINRKQGDPYYNGIRDARIANDTGQYLENPYPEHSENWQRWNDGFHQARQTRDR